MKLIVSSLLIVAACYGTKPEVERAGEGSAAGGSEDEQQRAAVKDLERSIALERARDRAAMRELERKIDELNRKLDAVIARPAPGGVAPRPPRPEPDRALTYAVPVAGNPFDGPAGAKVTLVRGYDYGCGYCEKSRATMDQLKQKYGKDLRIVYKHLVIHPRNAMAGALAFCAAAKQGKHREMDRLIWDKGFHTRQLDLSDVTVPGPDPADPDAGSQRVKCWDHADGCKQVESYAAELRLDLRRFKADLKGDCAAIVADDGRHFAQLSVSSTPAFFVNGRYVSGAQPVETFSVVIDEELKKANERIARGTPAASYYQKWVVDQGLKSVTTAPAPAP